MAATGIRRFVRISTAVFALVLCLSGPAVSDLVVPDDENYQNQYEIRNLKKLGIGTSYTDTMGALAHIFRASSPTTMGQSPQLLIGSAGNIGQIAQIGFGWTNHPALTSAPAAIGFVCSNASAMTKGDIFIATRDVTTDTAPTERMRVTAAGNVGIGTSAPRANLHVSGGFLTDDPYVDVRLYDSFADALAAIGSVRKTLLIPTEQPVTADQVVAENVHLLFLEGGMLNVDPGVTVSIIGPLTAPISQLFTGDGTVVFGSYAGYPQRNHIEQVYPQWWGAVGDNSHDDTAAIQAAVDSFQTYGGPVVNAFPYPVGGTIFFPTGVYKTTDTIHLKPYLRMIGADYRGTCIRSHSDTENTPVLYGLDARWIHIQDLTIEGPSLPGQHGIHLKRTGAFGVKFTFSRLALYGHYNAIEIEGDSTGSSMRDLYIRRPANSGLHSSGGSFSTCKFDSMYISNTGGPAIDISGAGVCTFNNIITEVTGGDGMRIGASRCVFNGLYLGDKIGYLGDGNGIVLVGGGHNVFNAFNFDGGTNAQSAIVLDGSVGNIFNGLVVMGNMDRYLIEWKNDAGTPDDLLKPSVFNNIVTTSGPKLGFCNDNSYVMLRGAQRVTEDWSSNFLQPFRPYEINADAVTIRTNDTPGNPGFQGYGAPDPTERWTFFRDYPGTPPYSFMARGSYLLGVCPTAESVGADLITGDSSDFDGGTFGDWQEGGATSSIASPGYGGSGYALQLKNSPGSFASRYLHVPATPGKLYRFTFRFNGEITDGGETYTARKAMIRLYNANGSQLLADSRKLTAQFSGDSAWRKHTMYVTPIDSAVRMYFYLLHDGYDTPQGCQIDEVYLNQVENAASLKLSGGRDYDTDAAGGIELVGKEASSNPGDVVLKPADSAEVVFEQDDEDHAFSDYQGTSAGDNSKNISTGGLGGYAGRIKIKINGTDYWMPYYSE